MFTTYLYFSMHCDCVSVYVKKTEVNRKETDRKRSIFHSILWIILCLSISIQQSDMLQQKKKEKELGENELLRHGEVKHLLFRTRNLWQHSLCLDGWTVGDILHYFTLHMSLPTALGLDLEKNGLLLCTIARPRMAWTHNHPFHISSILHMLLG